MFEQYTLLLNKIEYANTWHSVIEIVTKAIVRFPWGTDSHREAAQRNSLACRPG